MLSKGGGATGGTRRSSPLDFVRRLRSNEKLREPKSKTFELPGIYVVHVV